MASPSTPRRPSAKSEGTPCVLLARSVSKGIGFVFVAARRSRVVCFWFCSREAQPSRVFWFCSREAQPSRDIFPGGIAGLDPLRGPGGRVPLTVMSLAEPRSARRSLRQHRSNLELQQELCHEHHAFGVAEGHIVGFAVIDLHTHLKHLAGRMRDPRVGRSAGSRECRTVRSGIPFLIFFICLDIQLRRQQPIFFPIQEVPQCRARLAVKNADATM
jgi:hypothetical protein